MKTIANKSGQVIGDVNEQTSLYDMQKTCPKFFKTPHGKREAYIVYRGQLIVRNTVTFTGCKPERRTTVYLFCVSNELKNDFLCISSGNTPHTIKQAEQLIDRVLDGGIYYYGI